MLHCPNNTLVGRLLEPWPIRTRRSGNRTARTRIDPPKNPTGRPKMQCAGSLSPSGGEPMSHLATRCCKTQGRVKGRVKGRATSCLKGRVKGRATSCVKGRVVFCKPQPCNIVKTSDERHASLYHVVVLVQLTATESE